MSDHATLRALAARCTPLLAGRFANGDLHSPHGRVTLDDVATLANAVPALLEENARLCAGLEKARDFIGNLTHSEDCDAYYCSDDDETCECPRDDYGEVTHAICDCGVDAAERANDLSGGTPGEFGALRHELDNTERERDEALAEAARLRTVLTDLVEHLPRCSCGAPATRAFARGEQRFCDVCAHRIENRRALGQENCNVSAPDYPRAPALREAIAELAKRGGA